MRNYFRKSTSANLDDKSLEHELNESIFILGLIAQGVNLIYTYSQGLSSLIEPINHGGSNDLDNPLVGAVLSPNKPNKPLIADNATIDSRNKFNLQKRIKLNQFKGNAQNSKLSPNFFVLVPDGFNFFDDLTPDDILKIGDVSNNMLLIKASGESERIKEEGRQEASGEGGDYFYSEYYSSSEAESARESANEAYERGETERALEIGIDESIKSSEVEATLEVLKFLDSKGVNLETVMMEANISSLSEFAKLPSESIVEIFKEIAIKEIKEAKENDKTDKSVVQESETLKLLLDTFVKSLDSGSNLALKEIEAGLRMVSNAIVTTADAALFGFFKNSEKTESIKIDYFFSRNGGNIQKTLNEFIIFKRNEAIFESVGKMGITRADILRSSRGASEEHLLLKARPEDILANAKRAVQAKFGSGTKEALALEKEGMRIVKEKLKIQRELAKEKKAKEESEKNIRELEAQKALIVSQSKEIMGLEQTVKIKLQEIDNFFDEAMEKYSHNPNIIVMLKAERSKLETNWHEYLGNIDRTMQRYNVALEKNRLQNNSADLLQIQKQLKKEIPVNKSFLERRATDLVRVEAEILQNINQLEEEQERVEEFKKSEAYKEEAKINISSSLVYKHLSVADKIALEKAIILAKTKPPYFSNMAEGNAFEEFVISKLSDIYSSQIHYNPDNARRRADAFAIFEREGKEVVSLIEIMRSGLPFETQDIRKSEQAESYGNFIAYALVRGEPVEMKFIFSDLGKQLTEGQLKNLELGVQSGIKERVERRYAELITEGEDPKGLTKNVSLNIQIEVWK